MEDKNFEVKIYYTGFCTYTVDAENEVEAILKARNIPINQAEVLSNLENWKEADSATEVKDEESKI